MQVQVNGGCFALCKLAPGEAKMGNSGTLGAVRDIVGRRKTTGYDGQRGAGRKQDVSPPGGVDATTVT
jgi:hypothetical protein